MPQTQVSGILVLVAGVCPECESLWGVLATNREALLSSTACASALGLRNRDQLARWLGHHHYPPLGRLWDWVRVLGWMSVWEQTTIALVRQAWAIEVDPSVCYRTVRRLTGTTWRVLQEHGRHNLEDRFRQEILAPLVCFTQR